jgi:5-formyltetrahydrofolate cyclo-ligase
LGNTYFHIFSITEQKLNTEFILLTIRKDKEIIVSKADFETRNMTHFLLTDNKIKKRYNIPEPVDGIEVPSHKIDVVFCTSFGFRQKDIV